MTPIFHGYQVNWQNHGHEHCALIPDPFGAERFSLIVRLPVRAGDRFVWGCYDRESPDYRVGRADEIEDAKRRAEDALRRLYRKHYS